MCPLPSRVTPVIAALFAPLLMVSSAHAAAPAQAARGPESPALRSREPDGGLAFFSGASVMLAGFVLGGTLLATSRGDNHQNNFGWLTMQSGFAVAPLAAHAAAGEWTRALTFSAVPTSALIGSSTLFAIDPVTIAHGTLPQQRFMWGFFGVGLLSAAIGVVDAALAPERAGALRAIHVVPAISANQIGLQVGGAL